MAYACLHPAQERGDIMVLHLKVGYDFTEQAHFGGERLAHGDRFT